MNILLLIPITGQGFRRSVTYEVMPAITSTTSTSIKPSLSLGEKGTDQFLLVRYWAVTTSSQNHLFLTKNSACGSSPTSSDGFHIGTTKSACVNRSHKLLDHGLSRSHWNELQFLFADQWGVIVSSPES
jgi:hypothetical protein